MPRRTPAGCRDFTPAIHLSLHHKVGVNASPRGAATTGSAATVHLSLRHKTSTAG